MASPYHKLTHNQLRKFFYYQIGKQEENKYALERKSNQFLFILKESDRFSKDIGFQQYVTISVSKHLLCFGLVLVHRLLTGFESPTYL